MEGKEINFLEKEKIMENMDQVMVILDSLDISNSEK